MLFECIFTLSFHYIYNICIKWSGVKSNLLFVLWCNILYFVSLWEQPWRQLAFRRATCVFSHVQKGTLGLTHIGCVLQRVSLGALSDVTVVLGMRQSIMLSLISSSKISLVWGPPPSSSALGDLFPKVVMKSQHSNWPNNKPTNP